MECNIVDGIKAMLRELDLKQGDVNELLGMLSEEYEFWVLKWAEKTFVDIRNESDETEFDWA